MEKYFGTRTTDDTIYLLTSKSYSDNYLNGHDMFVVYGQGQGQLRVIEKSGSVNIIVNGEQQTLAFVKLNKPFEIAPNRNSAVSITEPRDTWFFVKNTFREGAASESYGTMINSVWDGNDFSRHEGQYFDLDESAIWYTTLVNQRYHEAVYVHGEGVCAKGAYTDYVQSKGLSSILLGQLSLYSNAFSAFTIRNCEFDQYGYIFNSSVNTDGVSGVVMKHCTFIDRQNPSIYFSGSTNGFTALLLRDNTIQNDLDYSFESDTLNAQNKKGYARVLIDNTNYDPNKVVLGDVNLDGKVTLKDATLISFYLFGEAQLSDQQLQRADCDKNDSVQLKDISIIKYWLLNNFAEINQLQDGDVFIGGDW